MKYLKYTIAILVLLNIFPLVKPAWAIDYGARITKAADRINTIASKAAERQSTELTKLQQRANTMIDQRITSLNTLLSRVQNDTRLSSADKATLTGNITTMISNLQSLKAKIAADTTLDAARADAKSIVNSYHIYATFEPQTRLLTIISNLQTTATNITNLVPQLQTLSNTLKSQGKDTSAIDTAITDINTQLTTINSLLSGDKTNLTGIATSTSANQATFVQIRQDLAKVRAGFAQIHQDMIKVRTAVKTTSVSPINSQSTSSAK